MKVSIDTSAFEQDVYRGVAACNDFMAKYYGMDPFYGFALYVDSFYTDCSVYYNTESHYQQTLQEYLTGEFGDSYRTRKCSRWELRWNPGDWPYSSDWPKPEELPGLMNMGKWSENARNQMDDKAITSDDWSEYGICLFNSACRVMEKLERDGVIDVLPRTNNFRSIISDHDEPTIYTYLRYERFLLNGTVIMPWDLDDNTELKTVLESFNG